MLLHNFECHISTFFLCKDSKPILLGGINTLENFFWCCVSHSIESVDLS